MSDWNILYRGSLSSCNYECGYCPFAKTSNTRAQLRADEQELLRFVDWVAMQPRRIGVLFTPWGEALIHSYYRRAIVTLSRFPNVKRVSIQTNLSAPLDDLFASERDKLALWTTFHPSQISIANFVSKCHELDAAGIRYSVGVVGLREYFSAIEDLRQRLRPNTYLWINAFKRDADYYQPNEIDRLLAIDPYFGWNLQQYESHGEPCLTGESTFSVDGAGNIRRCHFIDAIIGNIYTPGFEGILKPRTCSISVCKCHIGYVHRPQLRLEELYGSGLLERIPQQWPQILHEFSADTR
jgi:MoaA/NifB/PqqE/SkfB family radical SAM enzyme